MTDRRKKIEESEELSAMAEDLDNAKALDVMASSEGGKILADSLVTDIVGTIDTISSRYKDATHQEFIGWGADLSKMLGILRAMKRAKKNRQFLKEELEKALGE